MSARVCDPVKDMMVESIMTKEIQASAQPQVKDEIGTER